MGTGNEKCFVCGEWTHRGRRLLDAETAAKLCRVTKATMLRWIREDLVESVALPSGIRRVYLDSLFRDPPKPQGLVES